MLRVLLVILRHTISTQHCIPLYSEWLITEQHYCGPKHCVKHFLWIATIIIMIFSIFYRTTLWNKWWHNIYKKVIYPSPVHIHCMQQAAIFFCNARLRTTKLKCYPSLSLSEQNRSKNIYPHFTSMSYA